MSGARAGRPHRLVRPQAAHLERLDVQHRVCDHDRAGGSNWTRAFSTGSTTTVTYDFRPHTSSETGPRSRRPGPIIAVTWRVRLLTRTRRLRRPADRPQGRRRPRILPRHAPVRRSAERLRMAAEPLAALDHGAPASGSARRPTSPRTSPRSSSPRTCAGIASHGTARLPQYVALVEARTSWTRRRGR